ncbi:collagen alpha-1(I) chain-like isoform X4 [Camelus ferus]|uniref:Collagen alpha-1(I) chain-like isoform X4 n=1 Tax=Camelus ferus TaxID=419612 RepID=A0A8B8TK93_CAMFR|nr:collagen alpha-1(I) chain-like [Camelus dromedarius]XP_032342223.1 collagen alpha-1(I) chain-like isoform X4 [Camelus ferus]
MGSGEEKAGPLELSIPGPMAAGGRRRVQPRGRSSRGLVSALEGICICPGIRTPSIPGSAGPWPPEPPWNGLPLPTSRQGLGAPPWVPRSDGETLGETLPTLLSARERLPEWPGQRLAKKRGVGAQPGLGTRCGPGRAARRAPGSPTPSLHRPHLARAPGSPSSPRCAAPRTAWIGKPGAQRE